MLFGKLLAGRAADVSMRSITFVSLAPVFRIQYVGVALPVYNTALHQHIVKPSCANAQLIGYHVCRNQAVRLQYFIVILHHRRGLFDLLICQSVFFGKALLLGPLLFQRRKQLDRIIRIVNDSLYGRLCGCDAVLQQFFEPVKTPKTKIHTQPLWQNQELRLRGARWRD